MINKKNFNFQHKRKLNKILDIENISKYSSIITIEASDIPKDFSIAIQKVSDVCFHAGFAVLRDGDCFSKKYGRLYAMYRVIEDPIKIELTQLESFMDEHSILKTIFNGLTEKIIKDIRRHSIKAIEIDEARFFALFGEHTYDEAVRLENLKRKELGEAARKIAEGVRESKEVATNNEVPKEQDHGAFFLAEVNEP